MSTDERAPLTPEEVASEGITALPDKEVVSILDLAADVWEEPVAKSVHDDLGARCCRCERLGARVCLMLPFTLSAQYDPGHLDLRARPRQGKQGRAAANLDVV